MFHKSRGGECVVQFRAGKMVLKDGRVEPDRRRGTLSFLRDSDGHPKMTWVSGSDEEHYMLPHGQVKFSRVEKCATGRVLLFDFGSTRSPVFFWIQEKSTENDLTYFSAIHALLAESHSSPERSRARLEGVFQEILSSMRGEVEQDVDLKDILSSPKVLDALRDDPAFFMCRLHEYLPEGTDPTADIVEQVKNPQVSAAATSLSLALRTQDGFRELCSAFGVDGRNPNVLGFLHGLMKPPKK